MPDLVLKMHANMYHIFPTHRKNITEEIKENVKNKERMIDCQSSLQKRWFGVSGAISKNAVLVCNNFFTASQRRKLEAKSRTVHAPTNVLHFD